MRYGIEDADRRCRSFVALALVIIAMDVRDPESADVFRRTFRFIRGPALRRVRQNGEQFLIINGVRHENRFILRTHGTASEGDELRNSEYDLTVRRGQYMLK